jgi:hypothetical protein
LLQGPLVHTFSNQKTFTLNSKQDRNYGQRKTDQDRSNAIQVGYSKAAAPKDPEKRKKQSGDGGCIIQQDSKDRGILAGANRAPERFVPFCAPEIARGDRDRYAFEDSGKGLLSESLLCVRRPTTVASSRTESAVR